MSSTKLAVLALGAAPVPAEAKARHWYVPSYRVSLVREGGAAHGERPILSTSEAMARALFTSVADDGREHFGIAMLDQRHRLIGLHEVSVGCLTSTLVHPREVFGPALVAKSAALVLFHNHPSGDPEPSADDMALTRRLASGGQLLGVDVLDHLILCIEPTRYVSLKQRGVL